MNTLRSETEEVSTVKVSGAAELRDAAVLKAALIECLDRRLPTVLDLSALERADVATLQLICSAVRSFSEAGALLSIAGAGEPGAFETTSRAAGFPTTAMAHREKI